MNIEGDNFYRNQKKSINDRIIEFIDFNKEGKMIVSKPTPFSPFQKVLEEEKTVTISAQRYAQLIEYERIYFNGTNGP